MAGTLAESLERIDAWQQATSDSVDALVASINGIDGDVQNLKKQIADLQSSPGAITQEDQARLDKIETALNALSVKTAAAAAAAKTVDDKTEEVVTPS